MVHIVFDHGNSKVPVDTFKPVVTKFFFVVATLVCAFDVATDAIFTDAFFKIVVVLVVLSMVLSTLKIMKLYSLLCDVKEQILLLIWVFELLYTNHYFLEVVLFIICWKLILPRKSWQNNLIQFTNYSEYQYLDDSSYYNTSLNMWIPIPRWFIFS